MKRPCIQPVTDHSGARRGDAAPPEGPVGSRRGDADRPSGPDLRKSAKLEFARCRGTGNNRGRGAAVFQTAMR
jgi:hypothetical protein